MKNPYIILTNKNNGETIVTRHKFSKKDKLKDFLSDNKDCKIKMMFV
jgi:hypothetical protein